jgi:hypothetical protein
VSKENIMAEQVPEDSEIGKDVSQSDQEEIVDVPIDEDDYEDDAIISDNYLNFNEE